MALQPGQLLNNRYRIVRLLGQGGMGAVYLAEDGNLGNKQVAVKENLDFSPVAQQQFEAEALILARLSHPGLPQVTDHFILPSGAQYLVMQYIAGEDLEEVLARRGPLPEAEALEWISQALDALQYMHTWADPVTGQVTPVVHRDIKPANLKRTPGGRIMLVDFGIAKYQQPGGTKTGARAASPGFSPLEQYTGGTDACSDIYSVGATLYCLLTGRVPPEAPDLASGRKLLAAPRALVPGISANTEAVILRAMKAFMADRYQTVAELCAALAPGVWQTCPQCAALNRKGARFCQVCGKSLVTGPPPPQRHGRRLWPVFGVGVLLLSAVGITALVANLPQTPSAAPPIPTITIAPPSTQMRATQALALPPPSDQSAPTFTSAPPITPTPPAPTITEVPAPNITPAPIATEAPAPTLTPAPIATEAPAPTLTPAPTVTEAPLPGETAPPTAVPAPPPDMVVVPAGEFQMGCDPAHNGGYDCYADELPLHRVYLDAYYIDRTEVTVAQFATFVAAAGHKTTAEQVGSAWVFTGGKWKQVPGANWQHPLGPDSDTESKHDHPVTQVSWDDAAAYCRWAGKRLPTEAEWEKAARGGTDTRAYPWGDYQPDCSLANSRNDPENKACVGDTTTVGNYPSGASPPGALDMAGNVWQWVQDWYDDRYYSVSPSVNPINLTNNQSKVLRGGGWYSTRGNVRAANRYSNVPKNATAGIGFRCAASLGS